MKKLFILLSFLLTFSITRAQSPSAVFWVDFGPNDTTNGNITVSPDLNGNYWNNVTDGTVAAAPVNFVDSANNSSGISLTMISELAKNGIQNGGLLTPDPNLLGKFAIPTATQDYFFSTTSGAFTLSGLNKSKAYIFHFFGTRNSASERVTQYTFKAVIQLQQSLCKHPVPIWEERDTMVTFKLLR